MTDTPYSSEFPGDNTRNHNPRVGGSSPSSGIKKTPQAQGFPEDPSESLSVSESPSESGFGPISGPTARVVYDDSAGDTMLVHEDEAYLFLLECAGYMIDTADA